MQYRNTLPQSAILVLLMAALLFAACDDEPTPAGSPSEATADAEPSPSENAEEPDVESPRASDDEERPLYHLRSERLNEWSADAVLDEDFWLQTPTLRLHPAQQARHQHSMVHLLWSDDALLIGARLQSDHILGSRDRLSIYLQPTKGALWTRLDLHPRPQAQLFALSDDREDSIDASSVDITTDFDDPSASGFWIVEAKLPLDSIADAPDSWEDASWRGYISRLDYSPNETPRYYTLDGTHEDSVTPHASEPWIPAPPVEDEVEMRDYDPELDPSLLREMENQPPSPE